MANMSTRALIIQAHQAVNDEMRREFESMGEGGRYCQQQKDYAFTLTGKYGVRATARILGIPRRTLQRWCREQHRYVQRCPDWVYSWAAKRRKRREFWERREDG
jgi:ActR/RegA family two-component response regulator